MNRLEISTLNQCQLSVLSPSTSCNALWTRFDWWEFPLFWIGHWQSPQTVAGECLCGGDCGTVYLKPWQDYQIGKTYFITVTIETSSQGSTGSNGQEVNSLMPGDKYICHWTEQDIIALDNGLSPIAIGHHSITSINADTLSNVPLGTKFNKFGIKLWIFSLKQLHVNVFAKCHSICPGPNVLIVAWWCHMAADNWVNIGSGNGLVPDSPKPLPEPMVSTWFSGTHLTPISQEVLKISIHKISLEIHLWNHVHTSQVSNGLIF